MGGDTQSCYVQVLLRALTALLALAMLAGCGDDDEKAASASVSLEGTPWVLAGGIDVLGWEQAAPSAAFAGGKMAGSGGCNRYSAPATIDGSALTLGTAVTTKMACGSPANEVEQAFHTALERVAAWRIRSICSLMVDSFSM